MNQFFLSWIAKSKRSSQVKGSKQRKFYSNQLSTSEQFFQLYSFSMDLNEML